ncbi:hypothetical protein IAG44_18245 [Streptomyces roseirectus]|uniref:DUF4232 domain-containing protein n=1 Tax=Streptomyces roseirectus TaxID=2768066 RepID=A0A7H0IEH1_9ACTN|nr:hypothetical protein [Streptomyces roseirectus]QNP71187.1 hypothetical protein IAG44_18245 [Streptomyces roseirectus]
MNHHLDDQGPDGLDSDELELRRMLHRAVHEMAPRDGALDHLRRAVPARKARKRQAIVGVAAAVLFAGVAVPALMTVSSTGDTDANPAVAGQASQTGGSTGQGKNPDGGSEGKVGESTGGTTGTSSGASKGTGGGKETPTPGASSGAGPSQSLSPVAPACTADQLGSATSSVDGPDSTGVVYGTFRVVNVSATSCTVGGAVALNPGAQGAADAMKISVTEHVAGDAAAQLPDPSLYVTQLALAPGSAYDVKFAWVKSEDCPSDGGGTGGSTTGGDTGSSPTPSPSPSEQTTGTSTGTTGTSPQLIREDATTTDPGSVTVTYTADAGSPSVTATVPDACAGTIYRTGVLAAS